MLILLPFVKKDTSFTHSWDHEKTLLFLRRFQCKCPVPNIISVTHPCAGSRALRAQREQSFSLELHTSGSGAGLTVVPKPVCEHGSSLSHSWAGAVGRGCARLCCSGIGTNVCMTSSPARDGNLLHGATMYSNFLSSSSCLQIKYASKPPVYTKWFPRGAVFVWACQTRAITDCRGA